MPSEPYADWMAGWMGESIVESIVESPASSPARLAVTQYGDPTGGASEGRPGVHVVMVHGYPDDQSLWTDVVAHLPPHWHAITYDTRGAGRSSTPRKTSDYLTRHLLDDLLGVVDATVPAGERFHLVAHDWGSIALWDAVAKAETDPRLRDRLASYTSASGPSLDHLGAIARTPRAALRLLPQVAHSWYVWLFQVPLLPELGTRHLQRQLRPAMARVDATSATLEWGEVFARNATAPVNLYRANVLQRLSRPLPWRTSVPVRLLVATRDGYVTPRSLEGLEARCRDLVRVEIDGGHWWPRVDPERMAAEIAAAVNAD